MQSRIIPLLSLITISLLLLLSCDRPSPTPSAIDTATDSLTYQRFDFRFEGRKYSGILDLPTQKNAKSLIVLVPGSGKTRMTAGKWNYSLREKLNSLGIATYAYDKSGCGDSEGEYDYNQSVENSSDELLAAIQELRDQKIPGAENIGLWGISRAGWVCPLAISKDKVIKYWISVSGPNHLDNMYHLLKTNWEISGNTQEEINKLADEWLKGFAIQRKGGTYQEYLAATPTLTQDDFIKKLRGEYTEERFLSFQKYLMGNNVAIDDETGLQIMLSDFDKILSQVNIPVLAILGEKDSQVDWRETIALYKNSMGNNSALQIETLPDCNHFIEKCETGGYDESYKVLKEKGLGQICDGYFESIESWLASVI